MENGFNQTLENLNCSFRLKFENGRGIELSYNNDGSIFWSKDGWKNIVENMHRE